MARFSGQGRRCEGLPAIVYARHGYGQSDLLGEPRKMDFMHDEALIALPQVLAALGISDPSSSRP